MKAEWTNKDVLTQSETTSQSKSILVIDTPKNCAECKLIHLQGIGESICNAVDWSRRPSWCPLRPLPDKMEVKVEKIEDIMHTELQLTDIFSNKIMAEVKFETDKLIALGYNACIDEIVGGE